MRAEIIMIGTELLLGQIVDTNAAYLARELAELGFDVFRKVTVGDNGDRIVDAITNAMENSDVVITSGGLGPTVDDKTREAVAQATNRKLVMSHDLLKDIEAFFERRGLILGKNNPRQAY
ncbi:MAG: competence/damage-inducible protein A, partial [Deltaproteobacteria bacterium]|nr:competence/damage-inducible protein A [Deltaproteobacteria bacterium]